MKKVLSGVVAVAASSMLLAACGGSGGGGGGGLPAAEVTKVYQLNQEGDALKKAVQGLIETLSTAGQCVPGTQVAIDTGEVACSDSGTTRIHGMVDCTVTTNVGATTITINSVTATLTATGCVETVTLGADGITYNVLQQGTSTQFAFGNGTTITVETTNPPTITVNGSAVASFGSETLTYTAQGASGPTTATMSYTQHFTFNNASISGGQGGLTCAADTVTVTESGNSGTCTVSSECDTCS